MHGVRPAPTVRGAAQGWLGCPHRDRAEGRRAPGRLFNPDIALGCSLHGAPCSSTCPHPGHARPLLARRARRGPRLPCQAGLRMPATAASHGRSVNSNVSRANGISGSQVGSQRRQTQSDTGPHPARVAAGERHTGRYMATPCDGSSLYSMQEARGSSPLSSTGQKHNSNGSNSKYSSKVQQRRSAGSPYVCSDRYLPLVGLLARPRILAAAPVPSDALPGQILVPRNV
jgi:hypothetical protein